MCRSEVESIEGVVLLVLLLLLLLLRRSCAKASSWHRAPTVLLRAGLKRGKRIHASQRCSSLRLIRHHSHSHPHSHSATSSHLWLTHHGLETSWLLGHWLEPTRSWLPTCKAATSVVILLASHELAEGVGVARLLCLELICRRLGLILLVEAVQLTVFVLARHIIYFRGKGLVSCRKDVVQSIALILSGTILGTVVNTEDIEKVVLG